jgi:hypothetical protein
MSAADAMKTPQPELEIDYRYFIIPSLTNLTPQQFTTTATTTVPPLFHSHRGTCPRRTTQICPRRRRVRGLAPRLPQSRSPSSTQTMASLSSSTSTQTRLHRRTTPVIVPMSNQAHAEGPDRLLKRICRRQRRPREDRQGSTCGDICVSFRASRHGRALFSSSPSTFLWLCSSVSSYPLAFGRRRCECRRATRNPVLVPRCSQARFHIRFRKRACLRRLPNSWCRDLHILATAHANDDILMLMSPGIFTFVTVVVGTTVVLALPLWWITLVGVRAFARLEVCVPCRFVLLLLGHA